MAPPVVQHGNLCRRDEELRIKAGPLSVVRHTGDKHTEGMFAAAALLESYLRQIQSIEGNLREADENIDTVREVRGCHPAPHAAPLHCCADRP